MQKITIRPSVFETNSSSMHSIAVKRKYTPPTEEERRKIVAPYLVMEPYSLEYVIDVTAYMPYGYDRDGSILNSFIDKLCYVVSALFGDSDADPRELYEYKDLLRAIGVPEVEGFRLAEFTEDFEFSESRAGRYRVAWIDHESVGMLQETLPYFWTSQDNEDWIATMRRLLFDPECYILIEGDYGELTYQEYDAIHRLCRGGCED